MLDDQSEGGTRWGEHSEWVEPPQGGTRERTGMEGLGREWGEGK